MEMEISGTLFAVSPTRSSNLHYDLLLWVRNSIIPHKLDINAFLFQGESSVKFVQCCVKETAWFLFRQSGKIPGGQLHRVS